MILVMVVQKMINTNEILDYLHKGLLMNQKMNDIFSILHKVTVILVIQKKQLNGIKKELKLVDGMKKFLLHIYESEIFMNEKKNLKMQFIIGV